MYKRGHLPDQNLSSRPKSPPCQAQIRNFQSSEISMNKSMKSKRGLSRLRSLPRLGLNGLRVSSKCTRRKLDLCGNRAVPKLRGSVPRMILSTRSKRSLGRSAWKLSNKLRSLTTRSWTLRNNWSHMLRTSGAKPGLMRRVLWKSMRGCRVCMSCFQCSKYDVILNDYVNRVEYLNRQIEEIREEKLSSDQLNTHILNFKRMAKNIEVKSRKYIGISEAEWEEFDNSAIVDRPFSYRNSYISHYTQTISLLNTVCLAKKELYKIYESSRKKYLDLRDEKVEFFSTQEEKQRKFFLKKLKDLNDSMYLKYQGFRDSSDDSPSSSRILRLDLSNKYGSKPDEKIKKFKLKDLSKNSQTYSKLDDSSDDSASIKESLFKPNQKRGKEKSDPLDRDQLENTGQAEAEHEDLDAEQRDTSRDDLENNPNRQEESDKEDEYDDLNDSYIEDTIKPRETSLSKVQEDPRDLVGKFEEQSNLNSYTVNVSRKTSKGQIYNILKGHTKQKKRLTITKRGKNPRKVNKEAKKSKGRKSLKSPESSSRSPPASELQLRSKKSTVGSRKATASLLKRKTKLKDSDTELQRFSTAKEMKRSNRNAQKTYNKDLDFGKPRFSSIGDGNEDIHTDPKNKEISHSKSKQSHDSLLDDDDDKILREKITLNDLDDDVLDLIADYTSKVNQAENEVYEKLNSCVSQIKDDISETLKFINREFKKDSTQNAKFMKNIRVEFDQELLIQKREKADFLKSFKAMSQEIKDTYKVIGNFREDFEKISDLVAGILEDVQIQHVLDIQDELDRRNIALYGTETRKGGPDDKLKKSNHLFHKNNVLSLDKNCVSCSQSNGLVMKAFKMACLSYEPSKIQYKDKTYKRENLLLLKSKKIMGLLGKIAPIKTKNYNITSSVDQVESPADLELKSNVELKPKYQNERISEVMSRRKASPSPLLTLSNDHNASFQCSLKERSTFIDESLTNDLLMSTQRSNQMYYTPSKSPFLVNPRTMQIMLNDGKANKPGRDTRTCSSRGTILSSRHMKPRYRKFKANLSLNHRPLTDIQ
ncbi:unnamed protein product [Moneuplotes crassus]|uniref:Uncharacterized protein n=1 Tax=Euplotes crassus TaxID=5936 RepID=A0AAD1XAX0_EUPCR|nr:unnamed protein product [Moneuplotes crassus]